MKHQRLIIIIIVVGLVGALYLAGISKNINVPFLRISSYSEDLKWSIGIYIGKDPFEFVSPENISNPVLTANDVTDISAEFVADPFMVCEGHRWYMFFEGMCLADQG